MTVVVQDLLDLQKEINTVGPLRDHGADGTKGDKAHQQESSDHNPDDTKGVKTPFTDPDTIPEVHALDADSTGPWLPGWSMARIVAIVVGRHHSGAMDVLQNVLYDGKTWSRSWGWTSRPIPASSDQHTGHAHFSSRYGSGAGASNPENYTGSWGIVDALKAEQEDDVNAVDVWNVAWGEDTRRKTAKDVLFAAAADAATAKADAAAALAQAKANGEQLAVLTALLTK
jgi:hypothetical protein